MVGLFIIFIYLTIFYRAWHIARAYMRGAFGFGPPAAEPAARETENKALQS